MSSGKLINHQTVLGWSNNFKRNKTPFATDAAGISLTELEEFIAEAKQQCPGFNGFRIYLVRFPLTAQRAPQVAAKIRPEGNNLTQPSLVLVPTRSFDGTRNSGEDFTTGDDVFALAFGDPEDPGGEEEAILCPPKCP